MGKNLIFEIVFYNLASTLKSCISKIKVNFQVRVSSACFVKLCCWFVCQNFGLFTRLRTTKIGFEFSKLEIMVHNFSARQIVVFAIRMVFFTYVWTSEYKYCKHSYTCISDKVHVEY